jgi:hypothetical protein
MQVLSGPGVELEIDVSPFVDALHGIIAELAADFPRWDAVISCIDYALLRRKESRPDVQYSVLYFKIHHNVIKYCVVMALLIAFL